GDVIARSLDDFTTLLARLIAEPTFDEVELGRLLRESQGEIIEARDNDRSLATRQFRRVLFEGHPYGKRISGQLASIASIGRDGVRQYRRAFVRDNVSIAVSGDVTEEGARALAEKLVAGLPRGPKPQDRIPPPAGKPGRRLVFVDKPDRTQTQILIGCIGSHPR